MSEKELVLGPSGNWHPWLRELPGAKALRYEIICDIGLIGWLEASEGVTLQGSMVGDGRQMSVLPPTHTHWLKPSLDLLGKHSRHRGWCVQRS